MAVNTHVVQKTHRLLLVLVWEVEASDRLWVVVARQDFQTGIALRRDDVGNIAVDYMDFLMVLQNVVVDKT